MKTKILVIEVQDDTVMALTKKLSGLDVGMSYYSSLEKDEDVIAIVFAESLYITSSLIVEQLPGYLEALKKLKCIEVLDIMLDLIHQDMPEITSQSDGTISTEERIRQSIALLMKERYIDQEKDEPLFNQRNHWQAIYRILVDKGYCCDSDFDGFEVFIKRVMPNQVNQPYKKDSVRNINKTDFNKPLDRWQYDPASFRTRKPYERMVAVATRFKAILEENGL